VMITLTSNACRMWEVGSDDMPAFISRIASSRDWIVFARMTIREARSTDVNALAGLLRACIAGMQGAGIDQWDDLYPTAEIVAADVQAGTLIVAERAGALIGAVTLNQTQEPAYGGVAWRLTDGAIGVVHRLMIAPAVKRQGVGRALMLATEDRARSSGLRALRLDTFAENPPALGLYRALGYAEVGVVHFRKGRFLCFEKPID
jgi:GNAT superfamily N-acetyltransferase